MGASSAEIVSLLQVLDHQAHRELGGAHERALRVEECRAAQRRGERCQGRAGQRGGAGGSRADRMRDRHGRTAAVRGEESRHLPRGVPYARLGGSRDTAEPGQAAQRECAGQGDGEGGCTYDDAAWDESKRGSPDSAAERALYPAGLAPFCTDSW